MHARPPPRNVILATERKSDTQVDGWRRWIDIQVQIDTWDVRFADAVRERRQLAFGLPLFSVLAPDGLVPVRCEERVSRAQCVPR